MVKKIESSRQADKEYHPRFISEQSAGATLYYRVIDSTEGGTLCVTFDATHADRIVEALNFYDETVNNG